jgi:competence protein ComEA
MPPPPPFVLPEASWRARLAGMLAGAGRQSVAVGLVVLVALTAATVLWLRGTASPAGAAGPEPGGGSVPAEGGHPEGASLPTIDVGTAADTSATMVAVHLTGRVRRPGVVRLPQGSRVLDAIAAAGGATAGADLDGVNLARKLVDGEQIRVPAHGERPAPPPGTPGPGAAAAAPGTPVDLNTATAAQLEALPGVGEVTAARIVAYRDAHPFRSVEELRQVEGIGERRYAQLEKLVTVG